jgi:hypothetical protein
MPPLGKTANLNLNTFAAALSTECALTALTLTISRELHDEHHSDKDVQRLKSGTCQCKEAARYIDDPAMDTDWLGHG